MAQRKISGDDVFLFIDPLGGEDYSTVICLTSQTFNRSTEIIDAKSKCGPDTLPGAQTVQLTFEGQIMLDPDAGNISEDDLDDLWKNKTTIGWKLSEISPTEGSIVYSGTGFIARLDDTYSSGSPSTFSGEIGVYGDYDKLTATS